MKNFYPIYPVLACILGVFVVEFRYKAEGKDPSQKYLKEDIMEKFKSFTFVAVFAGALTFTTGVGAGAANTPVTSASPAVITVSGSAGVNL